MKTKSMPYALSRTEDEKIDAVLDGHMAEAARHNAKPTGKTKRNERNVEQKPLGYFGRRN